MNRRRFVSNGIGALSLSTTFLLEAASSGANVRVTGVVTNDKGMEVDGVSIRAEREGKTLDRDTSGSKGPKGHYELSVTPGGAFDLIYLHSGHHTDTFRRLADRENHTINKAIYPIGQRSYSAEALVNIYQNYEYLYLIRIANRLSDRERRMIREHLSSLEGIQVPDVNPELGNLVRENAVRIQKLYAIGFK